MKITLACLLAAVVPASAEFKTKANALRKSVPEEAPKLSFTLEQMKHMLEEKGISTDKEAVMAFAKKRNSIMSGGPATRALAGSYSYDDDDDVSCMASCGDNLNSIVDVGDDDFAIALAPIFELMISCAATDGTYSYSFGTVPEGWGCMGCCDDCVADYACESILSSYSYSGEYTCAEGAIDVNTCGGGGDDDDDICFSGDSTVQLASGVTKTMADLEVGDSILSADAAGKLSYSEVAFKPHGANSKGADFVSVTTESGKTVKATPTHLLVSCDGSLVQAKAAACLRTVNGDEAVVSIESFKANGIYSAVTLDNEFLVVDGVVASPFALAHGLVNAYYNLHRAVYKSFPSLMKMPTVVSANSLLAAGALLAMKAVSASEK